MPRETELQRALREGAMLYGPEPKETIRNDHFIREEREPPTFMDGFRAASRRLNGLEPIERLQNDHTVADQPDYNPRSGLHFRR